MGQLQFEMREVGKKSLMTVSGKIVFLGTFAYRNCKRGGVDIVVVVVVMYCKHALQD